MKRSEGNRTKRAGLSAIVIAALTVSVMGCAQRASLLATSKSTPPPIGPPAAAVTMPKVTEKVLSNGLTVLVSEYRSLPIMRFHLLLPGGGAYDPVG